MPIKQYALLAGAPGTFHSVLEELPRMTAAEFKKLAETPAYDMPRKVAEDTSKIERAFWRSLTINPPIYGADTPQSFFDKKLDWGWNLHALSGDLLHAADLPRLEGVNAPMTYWGMWRTFFSWHVEDKDLYSINYLHMGAPKMWYCIPPSARDKFDELCRNRFPTLYQQCPAFMRHKNVLFTPYQLRQFNIPFSKATQEEGEFIVLNMGAYHCGFNLGFNCAEAVNFATPEWITTGRLAMPCECQEDTVKIDMRVFKPWCPNWDDLYVSGEDTEYSTDEDDEDGSTGAESDEAKEEEEEEEGEEEEEEEEEEEDEKEEEEEEDEEVVETRKRPRVGKAGAARGRGVDSGGCKARRTNAPARHRARKVDRYDSPVKKKEAEEEDSDSGPPGPAPHLFRSVPGRERSPRQRAREGGSWVHAGGSSVGAVAKRHSRGGVLALGRQVLAPLFRGLGGRVSSLYGDRGGANAKPEEKVNDDLDAAPVAVGSRRSRRRLGM